MTVGSSARAPVGASTGPPRATTSPPIEPPGTTRIAPPTATASPAISPWTSMPPQMDTTSPRTVPWTTTVQKKHSASWAVSPDVMVGPSKKPKRSADRLVMSPELATGGVSSATGSWAATLRPPTPSHLQVTVGDKSIEVVASHVGVYIEQI